MYLSVSISSLLIVKKTAQRWRGKGKICSAACLIESNLIIFLSLSSILISEWLPKASLMLFLLANVGTNSTFGCCNLLTLYLDFVDRSFATESGTYFAPKLSSSSFGFRVTKGFSII
jgi:hypothetical protein